MVASVMKMFNHFLARFAMECESFSQLVAYGCSKKKVNESTDSMSVKSLIPL